MLLIRSAFLMLGMALVLAVPSAAVQAGLSISVGNATVGPGGTATVDVLLTSDSALDALSAFSVEYQITSSSGRELAFVDFSSGVPSDQQLGDSNYVFALTGSAAITTPPSGFIGPPTAYVGSDASDDLAGVSGPFTYLLTRLEVTTLTSNAPQLGDEFTISVVTDGGNTYFLDPSGQDLALDSTTAGTVHVAPEPSSLALWGLGMALMSCGAAARRRRVARITIGG